MFLHKSLSRPNSNEAAKTSASFKIAVVCMALVTAGVFMKVANDFAWVVVEVQHTIDPSFDMPLQAEGAFYFIEPLTTTL